MSSKLLLWGAAVVLCTIISSVLSYSNGASRSACQEMIPGHIRAHPLDPSHSFISIKTSASYLPGQLITVTVRSSRDFMGFLLQARSVRAERNGFGGGLGMERFGPLLVGGSWIRSPPGTHTLRCLFEGDTVTHSDKQLKRNLSFVWRAPDMPKGDIRFHITVVQSYFVYWTGIESTLVRDRSPSAWRSIETNMVDGASTISSAQETVTTAIRAKTTPKRQTTGRPTHATSLGRSSNTNRAVEILRFQKILLKDDLTALETNRSVTWTNTVTARTTLTLGSPPGTTRGNPGFHSGAAKGIPTGPFSYTTNPFPLTSSLADTTYTNTTTHFPLAPFFPSNSILPSTQNDVSTMSNDQEIKAEKKKLNNNSGPKHYKTFTAKTSEYPPMTIFYSLYTSRPGYHNLINPSKKKFSHSEKLGDNILTNSQKRIGNIDVTPNYQGSSLKTSWFQMSVSKADLKSQTDASQTSKESKYVSKQTSFETMLNFRQAKLVTQSQPFSIHGEKAQSDMSTESLRPTSQPLSQTTRAIYEPFLTPQAVTVSTGENQVRSQANIQTITPDFGSVPSNTSSSFLASDHLDFFPPSDSLNSSYVNYPSDNFTLHESVGSVLLTQHPLVTSTSTVRPPSPDSKNELKTTPANAVPPSPSPIAIPYHITTTQPTFPTSSTISSYDTSNYHSTPSLIPTTSPPFTTSSRLSSTTSFTGHQSFSTFSSNSFIHLSFRNPESNSATHFTNTPIPSSETHKTTVDHKLITQTRRASSKSRTGFTSPAHRKAVHPNPKPYPNLRPNHGQEIKPNIHSMDTKLNHPPDTPETPNNGGKYPDIIPRHRAWELGMLFAGSAGLGMVLVVGVRYVYQQACGRRTDVNLNDRQQEYGRGEQGLFQLQECGDLVRVRKLRENSFVLLAEYDILASPSN